MEVLRTIDRFLGMEATQLNVSRTGKVYMTPFFYDENFSQCYFPPGEKFQKQWDVSVNGTAVSADIGGKTFTGTCQGPESINYSWTLQSVSVAPKLKITYDSLTNSDVKFLQLTYITTAPQKERITLSWRAPA